MHRILRKRAITDPGAAEDWHRLDALLGVQWGIPRTVLIDRSGRVATFWIGPVEPGPGLTAAVL